jgi:Protein tyrosine and serine/threonine kinase
MSATLIPSTAPPVEMTYLKTSGEAWDLECVDRGRSGIILKLNPTRVLKAPLIIHNMDASEEEKFAADCLKDDNISFLENEKATFQRLGRSEHFVDWHALRSGRIEMKYMSYGPLSRVRQYHTPSGKQLHSWICSIAAAITYAHSRNVIISDVAARNISTDNDWSAKLCDFTDSTVLSFDVDISEESQDGASIYTDIFQFGSLVYETVTGKRFDFDLFHPSFSEGKQGERAIPCWPDKNQLPLISHLEYGATIFKCWSRGFEDMSSATAEIQTYDRCRRSNR